MYNDKVLDHFRHPRHQGAMADADGVGQVGNPVCGDIMKVYLKIDRNSEQKTIQDISFETLGCGAAIATSSMLMEMALGRPLAEALKIGKLDIAKELGGLPEAKLHCSVLAHEALKKAAEDYQAKRS